MKDKLKQFIDMNREAFDEREPSDKVWNAIEKTLPGMKQQSLWNSVSVWRGAALVFMALSAYFMISRSSALPRKEVAAAQTEFMDLESFYSSQIAEKVALIKNIDAMGDADPFTQDFQKLDAMYQVLREEMKNHPSEKVKDALVLNLLIRIDLLNQQIKKLEDSKKQLPKATASMV